MAERHAALEKVRHLKQLEEIFDACPRCLAEENPLKHVFGNGQRRNPEFCFVLINPTHSNLSTNASYNGPRFPFIGVRRFWRVLSRAGFISDTAMQFVEALPWQARTTNLVLSELRARDVYLTNLVKCAQAHSDVPTRRIFEDDFPLFSKEMSLVRPRYIVAFGQLTFSVLTNKSIKLNRYYERITSGGELHVETSRIMNGNAFPVIPNFFPVGRGNPTRASEILRIITKSIQRIPGDAENVHSMGARRPLELHRGNST